LGTLVMDVPTRGRAAQHHQNNRCKKKNHKAANRWAQKGRYLKKIWDYTPKKKNSTRGYWIPRKNPIKFHSERSRGRKSHRLRGLYHREYAHPEQTTILRSNTVSKPLRPWTRQNPLLRPALGLTKLGLLQVEPAFCLGLVWHSGKPVLTHLGDPPTRPLQLAQDLKK